LEANIKVTGADISARDNAALAQAAAQVAAAWADLRARRVIDDAELLRMVYKFAGELVDVPELLARGEQTSEFRSRKLEVGSQNKQSDF
jgi:hypothetical protein